MGERAVCGTFIKRGTVVEAFQWRVTLDPKLYPNWFMQKFGTGYAVADTGGLTVYSFGKMEPVSEGDWIVRKGNGALEVMSDEKFAQRYESYET